MNLLTQAEKKADESRNFPAFREFSLPGIREQVSHLLSQIGRVKSVFTTYSKHDISHIDAMLRMLDWIIPDKTQQKMTSADWLLVTLSIYLHDLGMLVLSEEYSNRNNNLEFVNWFNNLYKSNEGRDYLARTHRMSEAEKQEFFFQEYVRKGHAARIKEWIIGEHSRKWGPEIKPLSDEVYKLLQPLPIRFREYLSVVCESHHSEDLSTRDTFPLFAPCGTEVEEAINVQYAAILLRTTDLLHVTKDRTPSIMLQTIKLSDPKGISEWDKQLGTFSVLPKKREFDPEDPDSTIIQISANFEEEKPLFSLQEYITYANSQIHQSYRWVQNSQEDSDAKNYLFPWTTVKGDVRLKGVPPHPLKFELDRGRLLDLLVGHTIYNDPTVALRELLQNGIDAVRFQYYLKKRENPGEFPKIGTVQVRWNENDRYLIVEDNGIGMDLDTIENHLMKVGLSFYNTPEFETNHSDFSPISRFGIGILTCFMVSDDIEIITCRDNKGWRIRMTSVHADYLLTSIPLNHKLLQGIEPCGTRVKLRLRDTINTTEKTIEEILRYWIIVPSCPVQFIEDGKEVKKIGFDTVIEALKYYHGKYISEELNQDTTFDFYGKPEFNYALEIANSSNRQDLVTEDFELGIVLESALQKYRQFSLINRSNTPAVLVEGIRVSNTLPWFKNDLDENSEKEKICCLLSVRGDRKFRTTVSRAGLEEDEEFHRVGEICANLLFNQISNETCQIAKRDGQPLSQASSCSNWLYRRLSYAADNVRALNTIELLRQKMPCIVSEWLISKGDGTFKTERKLLTPDNLAIEPEFWTVESRLVDSLGIISRDLGRELSLNEFLVALAPNYNSLKYSPLLPDAQQFLQLILKSHVPVLSRYSHDHQQTAIKWKKLEDNTPSDIYAGGAFESRLFKSKQLLKMRDKITDYYFNTIRNYFGSNYKKLSQFVIVVANIEGNNEYIQAVRSKMCVFIKKDSELHSVWKLLKDIIIVLDESPNIENIKDRIADAIALFIVHLTNEIPFRRSFYEGVWRESIYTMREIISKNKLNGDIPDELHAFFRVQPIFDASKYWIDWYNLYTVGN
jgi:hypothetical protein